MIRLLLLNCFLILSISTLAGTIVVKNVDELSKANKEAKPGDIVILQNGEWSNAAIILTCHGTKEQPITFKAQTPGKVLITGNSRLKVGGNYLVVEGLYFLNGYAGDDPVISFRANKDQLANNSRVTNCVVSDFNNPKRMEENNWVLLYGKNNRVDHSSFINKKNMGVLLAVILDDDRSRENFHSIDHNYFGIRIPLASNGGEIIRVGVSQHCQFNSNTQITHNYFEQCDGETEIVSIKSGSNVVKNNLFKECQGGVVLRHGDNNTVENNIFLGNGKEGTGGVRIINKGQWVVNNFFYKCRGVDFRSPLSVMNGIPNSPAHRYVQVTDAVIANNTWYDCTPVSFCEGSDTERTLPPQNVYLQNNNFYNTKDSSIYKFHDAISGFMFAGNKVLRSVKQETAGGFEKVSFALQKWDHTGLPLTTTVNIISDSLQKAAQERLKRKLSAKPGVTDLQSLKTTAANAYNNCGAKWMTAYKTVKKKTPVTVSCKNAEEIYRQLERKEPVIIKLTGNKYETDKPFIISKSVVLTGNRSVPLVFNTGTIQSVFIISGNGHLTLRDLNISGSGTKANSFISNDSTGPSDHYSLVLSNCLVQSFDRGNGCESLFRAYKSMVADSIVIRNCFFSNNQTNGFMMNEETDNKGYYAAEKIVFFNNSFSDAKGVLLSIYRGGNDESTMGPKLQFRNNRLNDCNTTDTVHALIQLTGVQQTSMASNYYVNCNQSSFNTTTKVETTGKLICYTDFVRANHMFENNSIIYSGAVRVNKFVDDRKNKIRNTPYKSYY